MLDNTWEIMHIINNFNKRTEGMKKFGKEFEEIQKIYARALQITCANDYGLVLAIDDFIDDVADGYFMDYDGSGVFLDWEGNRQEWIRCDTKWLKENKKDYPFVRWFNK